MAPPMADDPAAIQQEEAREELRDEARAAAGAGYAVFDFIVIASPIVGGAIAFEEIDNWSQWVVLGRDHLHPDRLHDRRSARTAAGPEPLRPAVRATRHAVALGPAAGGVGFATTYTEER